MKRKLTIKQESFCQAYIETGNASEAYRRSYNAKNMKPDTVTEAASRLVSDSKVSARLDVLKAAHRKRHEVTVDSLTNEYEEARLAGMTNGQVSAAVSATTGKAKLHGLMVEKREHAGPDGLPLSLTINFVE